MKKVAQLREVENVHLFSGSISIDLNVVYAVPNIPNFQIFGSYSIITRDWLGWIKSAEVLFLPTNGSMVPTPAAFAENFLVKKKKIRASVPFYFLERRDQKFEVVRPTLTFPKWLKGQGEFAEVKDCRG